nr:ras GTPase-activating-like protein IQGAP1 isoform X2 [Pelodiscus sinensis]|eukprot:XP_014425897.1 ras GTPase-activating-like protein IQGAP1 isoform X2 [Pelodiscus sinensis]
MLPSLPLRVSDLHQIWMEACLNEDLPPTTELEEGLRNGVFLAKLGNFFSPKVVSLKKIYDREQTRYKATGLHFRHTDNVIQWLNAMSEIGLPKVIAALKSLALNVVG